MSIGSTAKNGLKFGLILGISGQMLSWISTLFVVRILNPEDFAYLATSEMLVGFLVMFGKLGFTGALIRKDNLEEKEVNTAFTFLLAINVFTYLVLFAFADGLESLFDKDGIASLILINALLLLLSPLEVVNSALLNKNLKFPVIAKIQLLTTILQSSLNLILVFSGFGFWSITLSLIVSQTIATICYGHFSQARPALDFRLGNIKKLWEDVNSSFLTSVLWDVNTRVDVLFIQSFFASNILGFYRMSKTISEKPVNLVSKVVQSITLSTFSKVAKDKALLAQYIKDSAFFAIFISMPLFVGIALTAENFVPLILGEKWVPAIPVIQILCLIQIVNSIKEISGIGLFAVGKGKRKVTQAFQALAITAIAWSIGVFFNITVALLLVFVGNIIWYILHIKDSAKHIELAGFFAVFKAPFIATIAMTVALVGFQLSLAGQSNILLIGLKVFGGIAVHFLTLKLLFAAQLTKFIRQVRK